MKKWTIAFCCTLLATTASAQSIFEKLKISKSESEKEDTVELKAFHSGIQQVLLDYPYNFKHVTGNLLEGWGQYDKYQSNIVIPNTIECFIEHYNSGLDTTASWNAIVVRTEAREEAEYFYKQINRRLRSCKVRVIDGSVYYLTGDYHEIIENADFATTRYRFQTADERFRHFYVNLEISYEIYEWVVKLYMGRKIDDADMRPDWWTGNE